jgi:hypothetical protein
MARRAVVAAGVALGASAAGEGMPVMGRTLAQRRRRRILEVVACSVVVAGSGLPPWTRLTHARRAKLARLSRGWEACGAARWFSFLSF